MKPLTERAQLSVLVFCATNMEIDLAPLLPKACTMPLLQMVAVCSEMTAKPIPFKAS